MGCRQSAMCLVAVFVVIARPSQERSSEAALRAAWRAKPTRSLGAKLSPNCNTRQPADNLSASDRYGSAAGLLSGSVRAANEQANTTAELDRPQEGRKPTCVAHFWASWRRNDERDEAD